MCITPTLLNNKQFYVFNKLGETNSFGSLLILFEYWIHCVHTDKENYSWNKQVTGQKANLKVHNITETKGYKKREDTRHEIRDTQQDTV
jgi:hypothetical protein